MSGKRRDEFAQRRARLHRDGGITLNTIRDEEEREEAKRRGAWWDRDRRCLYVPAVTPYLVQAFIAQALEQKDRFIMRLPGRRCRR